MVFNNLCRDRRAVVCWAAVAAMTFAYVSPVGAQMRAGSITAISGGVTITRAARTTPAVYGAQVDVGDEVRTNPNGRATITLTDNSQLEITESSSLIVSQDVVNPNGSRSNTSVTLTGGLVRSLVRFTAGTPPNFEVHTPNAVASARGTTYDTDYQNGANRKGYKDCREFTDVSVFEGTVVVTNPTNPSAPPVEVKKGQKTTVPCGLYPEPATSMVGAVGAGAVGAVDPAVIAAGAGAIVVGGVLGGVAGAGGLGGGGGGGGGSPTPMTSSR